MAVTYTTVALVKKRIEHIDATLIDADIEQYIGEAESMINCVMTDSLIPIFDATKHAIIRGVASDMAAYTCLRFNPSKYPSMEEAEMCANLLWDAIRAQLGILSDRRTVAYLKSL